MVLCPTSKDLLGLEEIFAKNSMNIFNALYMSMLLNGCSETLHYEPFAVFGQMSHLCMHKNSYMDPYP
jgi:hypothetical protein